MSAPCSVSNMSLIQRVARYRSAGMVWRKPLFNVRDRALVANINQREPKNRILAALPEAELALIATEITPVDTYLGQTLHRAGDAIQRVYFPEVGIISAMAVMADGSVLEIGMIGAEGMVGASVALGATTSSSEMICQTDGAAYCLPVQTLTRAMERAPHLERLLLKFVHAFGVQVAQIAACNVHHELSQRLARWLLAAHDRSGVVELALTHELLAVMLGVRRSTISVAAAALQKAGVIRYQHGRMTILDRAGLEAAACECYAVVAGEYRNFLTSASPIPGGRTPPPTSPRKHVV